MEDYAQAADTPNALRLLDEQLPEAHTVDWLSGKEASKYSERSGLPGLFASVLTWPQYIAHVAVEARGDFEAIRQSIIARKLWVGAEEHASEVGESVPVVDNARAYYFSTPGWGQLLCAVWSTENGKSYAPSDFYHWSTANNRPEEWLPVEQRKAIGAEGEGQDVRPDALEEPKPDAPEESGYTDPVVFEQNVEGESPAPKRRRKLFGGD